MRRRRTYHRQPPVLFFCHVVALIVSVLIVNAQEDPSLDYSCGMDWVNAANGCSKPCPSGSDEECFELGEGYGCYYFTGCKTRFEELKKEQEELAALQGEDEEDYVEIPPELNQFCAPTFIEAMLKCSKDKACPNGNECGEGEECFGQTNCDRELKKPSSDMIFNLMGLSDVMVEEDLTIFKSAIFDILQKSLSDVKIHLDTVSITNQRYFENEKNVEVRALFTAKYRPPPRQKLDSIIENSINLQQKDVGLAIKQAGNEAKRFYFAKLKEISAVSRENATNRPTVSPTGSPTFSPTGRPSTYPTSSPSESPSAAPSDIPSSSPSRMHIQEVATASSNELKSSTEGSYGIVFNMRTMSDGPVVVIKGLDFYSENSKFVGFELWSRLGSFKDFKGTYEGWDLIASGVVTSAGYGKFTSIPENTFTEVSIPGRGGERAFYLTLNSMDLIYRESEVESTESDSRVTASSPELEIYEGEAVLSYPFPDPNQAYLYRSPRQFLGAVQYDRLPCKPFSLYGPVIDLPCVAMPTMDPTKRPTQQPTIKATFTPTAAPEESLLDPPTMSPLLTPSLSPSVSLAPTISTSPTLSASPTLYPTPSPMGPIMAYVVVTLRRTLNRNMNAFERESFFDMFLTFLRKHTKVAMMVADIDLWRQDQIMVPAPIESNPTAVTPVVTTRSVGLQKVQATKLTLVLKISSTTLPLDLLGNMAVVAIEENQEELLTEIEALGKLYSFFGNIDQVVSFSISSVTEAPVASPAKIESTYDGQGFINEESSVRVGGEYKMSCHHIFIYSSCLTKSGSVHIPAAVITGVTILWLLLATFSILYIKNVRSKMKEQRIMSEDNEKIDPLYPDAFDGSSDTYSSDRNDEESGLRQNLRSSLSRSGGQRDLDVRGSLRDSLRRSDSRGDLRTSLRRSDSQGNLRGSSLSRSGGQRDLNVGGSLRDSLRRSDSRGDLRTSLRRSDSQGNLRGSSLSRSGGQRDLDVRGSLRDSSLRRSDSRGDLRTSLRRSDSQENLRESLRDSIRRSDGRHNVKSSMRGNDQQENLRRSLRSSQSSDGQENLRGSLSDSQRSGGDSSLIGSIRGSFSDRQDGLRSSLQKSYSQSYLRGSGNRGLRGSRNNEKLRGSGSNLRGSGNKGLRGSGRNELSVSFSETLDNKNELKVSFSKDLDNNVSDQRRNRNTDLSKSMTALDSLGIANELSEEKEGLRRRSDSDITSPTPRLNSSNDDIGTVRRSTRKGSRENLNTPGRRGNNSTLRRSSNERLNNLRQSAATRTSGNNLRSSGRRGRNGSLSQSMTSLRSANNNVPSLHDNERRTSRLRNSSTSTERSKRDGLRSSMRASGNNLRSSGRRGRDSSLSQSMTSLRSSDGNVPSMIMTTDDNDRPTSRLRSSSFEKSDRNSLRSSVRTSGNNLRSSGRRGRDSSLSQSMTSLRSADNEQSGSNSLRSSMRGNRQALSITRSSSADNDRPAGRLRNSTGSNNLRSSARGGGLDRSRSERPDSRLRNSSIEQRNNLRSSVRSERTGLSQSMRMSDTRDAKSDRRPGTRGDGKQNDSNFGQLVRQASARRIRRRATGETGSNEIESLKRNLIL